MAREAGRAVADGGRVLVLAPDGSTSERIAAALLRNGVPVVDDGSVPLSRHALVSAVRPLLPVFLSGGEAPVDESDLLRLLTDPVLSRSAPAGGIAPIPDLGDEKPRASTRHVRDLLARCRRARARLGRLDRVPHRCRGGSGAGARAGGRGRPPSVARHLATARILLAQVTALAEHARGGDLRDVERFLSALKLSDPEGDRLGHAVLGARWRARVSGLPPSTTWRTRLARVPAPDPFLRDADLTALGMPGPGAAAERLALTRWAASRARRRMDLPERRDISAFAQGQGAPDRLAVRVGAPRCRFRRGRRCGGPQRSGRDAR